MKKILMHTMEVIDNIGRGRKQGDAFNIMQEMRMVNEMSTPAGKQEKDFSLKSKILCKTDNMHHNSLKNTIVYF